MPTHCTRFHPGGCRLRTLLGPYRLFCIHTLARHSRPQRGLSFRDRFRHSRKQYPRPQHHQGLPRRGSVAAPPAKPNQRPPAGRHRRVARPAPTGRRRPPGRCWFPFDSCLSTCCPSRGHGQPYYTRSLCLHCKDAPAPPAVSLCHQSLPDFSPGLLTGTLAALSLPDGPVPGDARLVATFGYLGDGAAFPKRTPRRIFPWRYARWLAANRGQEDRPSLFVGGPGQCRGLPFRRSPAAPNSPVPYGQRSWPVPG
jgi:hypothetical protein